MQGPRGHPMARGGSQNLAEQTMTSEGRMRKGHLNAFQIYEAELLALRRLRNEDHEFKALLGYIVG